ncbi:o-succinylbenzoate--CoA ligase [Shewanella sp. C32]|uniref:O-succinylbenzoate--CoA ligase n=1 Tax=Shewanella electrica TaxID=515560 RepID=A0ABT2FN69_9GAMM|nr:o-succinylbenzoate--CoA ligase [Shewanella electrica]MCH1926250.1 o-succinylbenzoate--CoA ligase [Shewanella electrica]MCS4557782.1 o-succinylbenzoate--CoA ligase [Shewanella electrica]
MAVSPLHQAAARQPNAIALLSSGQRRSYQQLSQHVLALGDWLSQQGLTRGDKLGVIASNCIEMVLLYWACVDRGLLFSPLSPKFPEQQLLEIMQRLQINTLWCPDDSRQALWSQARRLQPDFSALAKHVLSNGDGLANSNNQPPEIEIDQPVDILLTSGSSGMPKGAVHSLSNHIANASGSLQRISLNPNDGWLLSLPLFHIGGLAIVNRCALSAATIVMVDDSLPLSAQLQRDPISHLSLVATQLQRLLADSPASLSKVKCLLLGGGAIGRELTDALQQLGISAFTSYGMTEMGSQITTSSADIAGSGELLPNRELCIKDGVIWVKGATLFLGYLQPDGSIQRDTDSDGWFCTKDRGYFDDHGQLHIQGRSDNMFICGGENIQPEEVEAALKLHPQILDAIVFGEANAEFGLLPSAILKTSDGTLPTDAELTEFLLSKIARFKRPRVYYPWPDGDFQGLKVQRKLVINAIITNR